MPHKASTWPLSFTNHVVTLAPLEIILSSNVCECSIDTLGCNWQGLSTADNIVSIPLKIYELTLGLHTLVSPHILSLRKENEYKGEKMSKKNVKRKTWSLTIMRDGNQKYTHVLCEAEFRYGRSALELSNSKLRCLPEGLVQLIEEHPFNLYEEALETGVLIEISERGSKFGGWKKFTTLIYGVDLEWAIPHKLYSNEEGSTIEFSKTGRPCENNSLPPILWIRVKKLPINSIAWAVENSIFDSEKTRQLEMSLWVDLPRITHKPAEILVMPGPPLESYDFLGFR